MKVTCATFAFFVARICLFIGRRQTIKQEKRWEISLHVRLAPSIGDILVEACWPTTRFERAPSNVRRLFPSITIFSQGRSWRLITKWGSAILPEVCLYACLRYLAGGLYLDIKYFAGVSDASLFSAVWKCIDSINVCDELTVEFPTAWIKVKEAARGFETKNTHGCVSVMLLIYITYKFRLHQKMRWRRMCNPFSLVMSITWPRHPGQMWSSMLLHLPWCCWTWSGGEIRCNQNGEIRACQRSAWSLLCN